MSVERNIIIIAIIQSFTVVPSVCYSILSSQFLFYSIVQFVYTFIEDVKLMMKKYDVRNVKQDFIGMINFHRATLK